MAESKNRKTCGCESTNNLVNTYSDITNKRIQNTVRVPSSLYSMNLATLNVSQKGDKFNGLSDRTQQSVDPITKAVGVDVKHGSYARYLARKKGGLVRKETDRYTIVNSGNCNC
tara:strand:- start:1556 stop:1897 length:342 start_codon:yes stop_codon:yes gene_type:complete